MAVEFPKCEGHPNRVPFEGCLLLLDTASDGPVAGAHIPFPLGSGKNHRVVFPRAVAEAALPTLLGMSVNYGVGFEHHDKRNKVGIITEAHIEMRRLMVSGYVFGRDYPEVQACTDPLGMSYEIADAGVANVNAEVWRLTKATFTGASALHESRAAHLATFFRMAPLRGSGR